MGFKLKWAQLSGPNLRKNRGGKQSLSNFALVDEKYVGPGLLVVKLGLAISIGDGTGGSV